MLHTYIIIFTYTVHECTNSYNYTRVLTLNIAIAVNPAIMALKEIMEVLQGSSVELEVYVSGYPIPTELDITWKGPDFREISDSDDRVDFHDGHRRVTLSNIELCQAGLYTVKVSLPLQSERVARTEIHLVVYCK